MCSTSACDFSTVPDCQREAKTGRKTEKHNLTGRERRTVGRETDRQTDRQRENDRETKTDKESMNDEVCNVGNIICAVLVGKSHAKK